MHLDWFGIVGWFFTFFGLLGNSWVIFIIARRRRLQTTTKWFIGGRSGWYLRESSAVSMICDVFVNTCNKRVRLISADFFIEASIIFLTAMIAERYITIVQICPFPDVLQDSRYYCELLDNSIPFRHLPNYHPSWQQRAFRRRHV